MTSIQQDLAFDLPSPSTLLHDPLDAVKKLRAMHQRKELGGEVMPEDANPGLARDSEGNAIFFTLPMALNYQRNSYSLWPAATKCFLDQETAFVFSPSEALQRSRDEVRHALTKYKVALQPNRHVDIWLKVCDGLMRVSNGNVRELFRLCDFSVSKIKHCVQIEHKPAFPYLSGEKICNYWIYVMEQYAGMTLQDREAISIAPDTHVLQASVRLGVITVAEAESPASRTTTADRWAKLLQGTGLVPIDIHTPLWLWSRKGFPAIL